MPSAGLPAAGPAPARIIDVTVPIRDGMPVWPGDPPVLVGPVATAAGVSMVSLGSHTGTHVDAPRHLFDGGTPVDALPLDALIGPCRVAQVRAPGALTAADLNALGLPGGVTRLLLKSDAARSGQPVELAPSAAEWIVANGIRLIGVEAMSIENPGPGGSLPAHETLLAAGVIVLEGLDLTAAAEGVYTLVCLPLLLAGADGAPARVVLIASGLEG